MKKIANQNINSSVKLNNIFDFNGVPLEVCNFHINSHNILNNWLKAHEEQPLNQKDFQHYKRMLILLKEILNLMEEIKTAVQFDQLKKLEIFDKVQVIVANQLGIAPEKVTILADIANDLGADSLDTIEMLLTMESAFNIEISEEISGRFFTIKQLINNISKKVALAV